MKSVIAVSAIAALAASSVNAATVNSPPSLIECQPAAISWSEAQGDVFLSVVKGKDISAAALETFPTQSGASGSYTWTVDQPAGTELTFVVNDSSGKPNYSSQVTVNAGSTSCLNGAAASGSSSAGASSTSGASSGASSASSSASKASSSAGSKTSSAGGNTASAGAPSASASSGGSNGAGAFAQVNGATLSIVGAVAAGFALLA
ncbi:unnamed protein product [Sympodiomycopsis kandeliae]